MFLRSTEVGIRVSKLKKNMDEGNIIERYLQVLGFLWTLRFSLLVIIPTIPFSIPIYRRLWGVRQDWPTNWNLSCSIAFQAVLVLFQSKFNSCIILVGMKHDGGCLMACRAEGGRRTRSRCCKLPLEHRCLVSHMPADFFLLYDTTQRLTVLSLSL
jgi:hypothetical protein